MTELQFNASVYNTYWDINSGGTIYFGTSVGSTPYEGSIVANGATTNFTYILSGLNFVTQATPLSSPAEVWCGSVSGVGVNNTGTVSCTEISMGGSTVVSSVTLTYGGAPCP
jgi:hypothetical protein